MSNKNEKPPFTNSAVKEIIKDEKRKKQELYIKNRNKEVEILNKNINEKLNNFKNIIIDGINNYKYMSIEDFIRCDIPKIDIPKELLKEINTPIKPNIKSPNILQKLSKKHRFKYIEKVDEITNLYIEEFKFYNEKEELRKQQINKFINEYNLSVIEAINTQKSLYTNGHEKIVSDYKNKVLKTSMYSFDFDKNISAIYCQSNKKLIIDYLLPPIDIVPKVDSYRYVKTKDEIKIIYKKEKEVKEIYKEVILSIALRSMYELISCDISSDIENIVFNGYINDIDLSKGIYTNKYIISAMIDKNIFDEVDITRVDKLLCMKEYIKARVSIDSNMNFKEIIPILKYNHDIQMLEKNNSIDLLNMNCYEFEDLIVQLFNKMGYNVSPTKYSNDGGVDFTLHYEDYILNGVVLGQVKRYKNTIDIPKLREFESVVRNNNAMKGIFITTSDFSSQCEIFARENNIELIRGSELINLLRENQINAHIE